MLFNQSGFFRPQARRSRLTFLNSGLWMVSKEIPTGLLGADLGKTFNHMKNNGFSHATPGVAWSDDELIVAIGISRPMTCSPWSPRLLVSSVQVLVLS